MRAPDLIKLLKVRYKEPEYIHLEEIQLAGNRRADLVSISLWGSRGQLIRVFELKSSRGDWLRELKDPEKADPLVQSSNEYIVVAPQGVIHDGEVPEVWGWLEAKGGRLYTRQKPQRREVEFTKKLACRLLQKANTIILDAERAARVGWIPVADIEDEVERRAQSKVWQMDTLKSQNDRICESMRQFEKMFGFTLDQALNLNEVEKVGFMASTIERAAERQRARADRLELLATKLKEADKDDQGEK